MYKSRMSSNLSQQVTQACPQCNKLPRLCICSSLQPLNNSIQVLILQHPQEPDHDLGSARIAQILLKNSTLKIGLSWPNLQKALGKPATPSQWAVLYLGSGLKGPARAGEALHFVSKQGVPRPKPQKIEGLIVLDGTWSQAKAIWWRNPWLLKVNRAILTPSKVSLYGNLRKEPRRECLSTIESIGEALSALQESPEIEKELKNAFSNLLKKVKSA